jgi:hypothetical protein
MINLMYLVLTALLALNVSAEVMNAFFSLDRGLKGSRDIVGKNECRGDGEHQQAGRCI